MENANMAAIRLLKVDMRKRVQASLKELSKSDVSLQSSRVHNALFGTPEYQKAQNISIYLSMPIGEITTAELVKDAMRRGKNVFVPFLYKNPSNDHPPRLMDMVSLNSELDFTELKLDRWGIPTVDAASVSNRARCLERGGSDIQAEDEQTRLDLVVMPGVAFDSQCHRLGHGKGFYDFFLDRYKSQLKPQDDDGTNMPYLVGLALDRQFLVDESVPVTSTDWPLNALIVGDGLTVIRST